MLDDGGVVERMMIHVMAGVHLGGAAVSAPIMRNHGNPCKGGTTSADMSLEAFAAERSNRQSGTDGGIDSL
jgi:hypothetical protein